MSEAAIGTFLRARLSYKAGSEQEVGFKVGDTIRVVGNAQRGWGRVRICLMMIME